jgi:L-amino acid N-acyltransferase YncA
MSSTDIRPAGPCDVAAITRIYSEAVANGTATFEIEPPPEAEMARRLEALLAKDFPYLVAERAGVVGGYAYAAPYHVRPAYRWSIEDSVYVAPEFQRQGLGRLLLARLIEAAETRGFRQMIAVIGDSANAGSIALHAAAGFRGIGVVQAVGFKHGRWLDTVLMQRPLGRGDATAP